MQRGFQVGLLLLAFQLFQQGLGNIPVVTLSILGFNVYLYMFPAASPINACVSLQLVYRNKEWRRLFLWPLHHVDDWHLYYNMASLLWKGVRLERRLGSAWFLYLLSVFSLLSGLMYLLLQDLMVDPLVARVIDLSHHSNECAVGFSGVLFGLKVVINHHNPGGVTYVMNMRVSNRFASWVELLLIYLIAPGTSLVAHLAGITVGLLYTLGPLKMMMEAVAELLSSDLTPPRSASYFSSSGSSGTRPERREDPQQAENPSTDDWSDSTESYVAGLTEEEQIQLAIRRSLKDRGPNRQRGAAERRRPRGFQTNEDEPSPEEQMRRTRLRRFDQHDRRRTRL